MLPCNYKKDKGRSSRAEEFDRIGLNHLVTYRDGQPDALKYELVSLYLLEVVKENVETVKQVKIENESLKQRLASLEEMMAQQQVVSVK